jgi:glycosyltransferase involved in cell wall biosynthesis
LFASGDSRTNANLAAPWPQALRFDRALRDAIAPHMLLMEQVCARADEFDVLHSHLDYWPFSLLSRQPTPFLTTLHGRLDLPELQPIYDNFPEAPLVSISDAQREPLPQGNFVATIHHGLPVNLLTPRPVSQRYLAFLGRICPEKRADRAIRIARQAGLPLKIAAKVDRVDEEYFHETIEPMIDGNDVELIGEIDDTAKPEFLSGAIALMVPIDWPEPFGLVMIEAMACGTPVIAFDRGSVREIVEHGVNGFVVGDEAEAVAAIGRLDRLSRSVVRRCFEQRFTAKRMAEDYLALYRRLAVRSRPALRVVT